MEKNPNRLSNYEQYADELNFDGIDFPMSINDIKKFEAQNENISINVHMNNKSNRISPLRITENVKEKHIHLLLLVADEPEPVLSKKKKGKKDQSIVEKINSKLESGDIKTHYCWIKDLVRLVSRQQSSNGHRKYICDRCLNFFFKAEKFRNHIQNCESECKIQMPFGSRRMIKFKNYEKQLKAPFVIYADTEAFLRRMDDDGENVFNENCATTAYQEHISYNIGYYFKCEYDDNLSYYRSSGNSLDCIDWFIRELEQIAMEVAEILSDEVPMRELTLEEEHAFQDPTSVCHICQRSFERGEKRVHDHSHLTGNYRGVAHNACNLLYQESREIPIVFHNLSG